jgi:hypothetical protein
MDDKFIEIAARVADDCIHQRDKFAIAIHRLFYSFEPIRGDHKLQAAAAYPAITAFQIVQNAYFIKKENYVPTEQLGEFVSTVYVSLEDKNPSGELKKYIEQYEINMQKPYSNQLEWFCQDAATSIVGSDAGMIYGVALLQMTHDFLLRNWAVVAENFGDKESAQTLVEMVKALHNGSSF